MDNKFLKTNKQASPLIRDLRVPMKNNLLYSTVHIYIQISGLEKDLETQKEESKQKLQSLETQMSQVTADLTKLKENDKNEELSGKLSQLGTDLDQKLTTAESKMAEFMDTFEKFQSETSQAQTSSKQKLDDVEIQIKSFKSSSEGTVQDVMEDNENLKVC